MKTTNLILLLLLIFFCNNCIAQHEFAPIGAKWTYTPWCPASSTCKFYTLESIKDTIVANQTARLLQYTEHTAVGAQLMPDANLIMYGDGDRVYYYIDDQFEMLYDFSAQVGDTVTVRFKEGFDYGFYSQGNDQLDGIFKYRIDSVSTMNINNQILRVQETSSVMEDSLACWGFGGLMVEKIGHLGISGIFGEACIIITAGFHGRLRCYEDEFISFNQTTVDCDYINDPNSVEKEVIALDAYFYPNPTLDNIHIKYPFQQPEEVQISIFDINGKLKFSEKRMMLPNQEINISIDDAGVFFVKMESKHKIFVGQFIRN